MNAWSEGSGYFNPSKIWYPTTAVAAILLRASTGIFQLLVNQFFEYEFCRRIRSRGEDAKSRAQNFQPFETKRPSYESELKKPGLRLIDFTHPESPRDLRCIQLQTASIYLAKNKGETEACEAFTRLDRRKSTNLAISPLEMVYRSMMHASIQIRYNRLSDTALQHLTDWVPRFS